MSGRVKEPHRILVDPVRVVARRSTDTHATEDRNLALAVRFIQDNVVHPISVDDVVNYLDCSRRSLEQRFRQFLGRSINREIQQIRIERVKRLLAETNLSMLDIAEAAGFGSSNYMIRLFRHTVDQTPVEYRNQVRLSIKVKNSLSP
jgi:LacI family transcriptional regulator